MQSPVSDPALTLMSTWGGSCRCDPSDLRSLAMSVLASFRAIKLGSCGPSSSWAGRAPGPMGVPTAQQLRRRPERKGLL